MMSFDFENYDALFAKEPKKAKEIAELIEEKLK